MQCTQFVISTTSRCRQHMHLLSSLECEIMIKLNHTPLSMYTFIILHYFGKVCTHRIPKYTGTTLLYNYPIKNISLNLPLAKTVWQQQILTLRPDFIFQNYIYCLECYGDIRATGNLKGLAERLFYPLRRYSRRHYFDKSTICLKSAVDFFPTHFVTK